MKRRILAVLALMLVAAWSLASNATAQAVNNFQIKSFEGDYYLNRTEKNVSTMMVVERITAEFPDFDQNHGILRAIPKKYEKNNLDVNVESVTDENGTPYEYTDYTENDNLVLRIGDPERYVRGPTTYIITYHLKNVVKFYDQYDELYWDINGDQWPQTFDSVTARLHLPDQISSRLNSNLVACYAGAFRQSNQDCELTTEEAEGETVVTAQAQDLGGYETLSMVTGFSKGTFEPDHVAALMARVLILAIIGGVVLPPMLTILIVVRKWRKYGRDPKGSGVIIPQYKPLKGMTVAVSDAVLNEGLSNKAVTATVIDLAVRKYVVVHEKTQKKILKGKTDYELELIKSPTGLQDDELAVIDMFFGSGAAVGSTVQLKDLKSSIYTKVAALGKQVSKKAADSGFFVIDPTKARKYFLTPAIVLLIIGFLISFTVVGIPLGIGLGLSAMVLFITNIFMPARTPYGVETKEYLLGLKDYIAMAEVDRLKFLQSVMGSERLTKDNKAKIKLFESLLPYAMLFNLEKSWAAEFQDIYHQPPDWYDGNWRTFNAVYLASSLSDFSSVSGATFNPPSSSGSSGFSSGGGFSGGGGGGGGGGGW